MASSDSASPLQSEISTSTVVPGRAVPDGPDGLRHGARAPVGQVVAGDAGHHGVAEPHPLDRVGHPLGLVGRQGQRMAGVDLAEAAGPGAALAVDHEGGGAVGPALVDVRAARLLAHGDQAEVVDRSRRAGGSPCRCARGPGPSPACAARCRCPPRAPPRPGAAAAAAVARSRAGVAVAPRCRSRRPGARPRRRRTRRRPGPRRRRRRRPSSRRRPRPRSEVTPRSAMPHGTMCPNMARSEVTLRATPCRVRRRPGPTRMVRTPMAAIFRGSGPSASTQTPGYSSTLPAPGSPRSASASMTSAPGDARARAPDAGSSGTVTIG